MSCRHEEWFDSTTVGCRGFFRRCCACGETLPHGEAREEGEHAEAVAVELRAAALVAGYRKAGRLSLGKTVRYDDVHDGAKVPEQDGEWAGWIARRIVEHDAEQGGE